LDGRNKFKIRKFEPNRSRFFIQLVTDTGFALKLNTIFLATFWAVKISLLNIELFLHGSVSPIKLAIRASYVK